MDRQIRGLNSGSVNLNRTATQPSPKKGQSKLKSLLQFAAPVAGSLAGIPGGPVGMLAGGAGASYLLNALGGGREGQTPMDAAKTDALYSLLGFGVGKVAGPFVGAAGRKLFPGLAGGAGEAAEQGSKLSGKIRGNFARPDVAKGALYEPEVEGLQGIARNVFGLKGSARDQSRRLGKIASVDLPELVGKEIAENNAKVTAKQLAPLFKQNIENIPTYSISDKPFAKALQTQLGKFNKAKDIQGLVDFKSKLPVSKIFPKLEAGGTLTQNESAILVAHQAASDAIEKFGSGGIRTLNQLQNKANPIGVGLQQRAGKTMSVPFGGSMFSGIQGPIQSGTDLLGRGIGNLAEAGATPLGRAAAPAGLALGAGLGNVGESTPPSPEQLPPEETMGQPMDVQLSPQQDAQGNKWLENPANGEILSEDMQWIFDKQTNDWIPNTQLEGGLEGGGELQQLRELAKQDLAGGGKNLSEIAAYMKIAGLDSGGDKKLGVTAAQRVSFADSGQRGLQAAAEIFQEDPGVLTKQLIPGKFASRKFDNALFRAVENLLRAKTGAAAPEQEVRRYMGKFGPTFGDDEATAIYKLEQMFLDLEDIRNSAGQTDPTSDSGSGSQGLETLQGF